MKSVTCLDGKQKQLIMKNLFLVLIAFAIMLLR